MVKFGDISTKQYDKFVKNVGNEARTKQLLKLTTQRLNSMANYTVADVKNRTPVDTGELRRRWQRDRVSFDSEGAQVRIHNNMNYAPYIEYGHRLRVRKKLSKYQTIKFTKGWIDGRFMFTFAMGDLREKYNNGNWSKWLYSYFEELFPHD